VVTVLSSEVGYCVDVFVASGGIPTSGLGVRHVGIFVGTTLHFHFGENPLDLSWGFMGLLMGFVGLCWGFTPTCVNKQF
jgi:hypothetical protein